MSNVTWRRNVQHVARVRGEGTATVWGEGPGWPWYWSVEVLLCGGLVTAPRHGESASLRAAKGFV